MSELTQQEKYDMAKRMDEAYLDTFQHMKTYYSPYEIFIRSGLSYEQLLEAKEVYETAMFGLLKQYLNSKMIERESGEALDLNSLLDYLELPIKNIKSLREKIRRKTLPIDQCRQLIDYYQNHCREDLPV